LLQQEAIARQLCDSDGNRLAGVDWRFAIAVTDREGSVGFVCAASQPAKRLRQDGRAGIFVRVGCLATNTSLSHALFFT
jgi:hypothetical protein